MSDFSLKSYVTDHKTIHLVGIGGVSMSALAELLLHLGAKVTGSDRTETDVTDKLAKLGASITYAHLPENVDSADLVIRTAAVHDDNPEIAHARELGIPVMERAQAWGKIMLEYKHAVCVSGTHGKTTTTSMLTMIGIECGSDPTVMVGSNLDAIGGTLRMIISSLSPASTPTPSSASTRRLPLCSMSMQTIWTSSRTLMISFIRSTASASWFRKTAPLSSTTTPPTP